MPMMNWHEHQAHLDRNPARRVGSGRGRRYLLGVQRLVERLGYKASRNQVRLEILNRLRRYGFAPAKGTMTPQQWQIARSLWREREFCIREMPNGKTQVWPRGELG